MNHNFFNSELLRAVAKSKFLRRCNFQAGDPFENLLPFGVRAFESSLMSVVYVLILPESDRHVGIQYDRFSLHACDQCVRVRGR